MKQLKQFFFIAISALLLLPSCSIDKRLYSPGYHVEWNTHKKETENTSTASVKEEKVENENLNEEIIEPEIAFIDASDIAHISASIDKAQIILPKKTDCLVIMGKVNIQTQTLKISKNNNDKNLPIESNATASLFFGILVLTLLLVFVFTYAGFAEVGMIICSLFAFIFGGISKARIRNEPDKYGGYWVAVTGICFGLLPYILLLFFLLLFF